MEELSEYQNDEEILTNGDFKERPRERKKRKKKHYLVRFLVFLGICFGFYFFISSSFFTVNTITVENNDYYSDEEIVTMANVKTGVNIFFDIDKSDIIDRLKEEPYFAEIDVKRKFPNNLIIQVKERKQVAAFAYGDQYVVIDAEGVILKKTDIEPKLTLLKGLTISKLKVGEQVDAEEKVALRNTLKMLEAMEDGDIFFKKIIMSKVLIKAYIYDTLICKGTPKQMLSAIESGDLQKVLNKLFKSDTKRGTITLGSNNYVSFSPALD